MIKMEKLPNQMVAKSDVVGQLLGYRKMIKDYSNTTDKILNSSVQELTSKVDNLSIKEEEIRKNQNYGSKKNFEKSIELEKPIRCVEVECKPISEEKLKANRNKTNSKGSSEYFYIARHPGKQTDYKPDGESTERPYGAAKCRKPPETENDNLNTPTVDLDSGTPNFQYKEKSLEYNYASSLPSVNSGHENISVTSPHWMYPDSPHSTDSGYDEAKSPTHHANLDVSCPPNQSYVELLESSLRFVLENAPGNEEIVNECNEMMKSRAFDSNHVDSLLLRVMDSLQLQKSGGTVMESDPIIPPELLVRNDTPDISLRFEEDLPTTVAPMIVTEASTISTFPYQNNSNLGQYHEPSYPVRPTVQVTRIIHPKPSTSTNSNSTNIPTQSISVERAGSVINIGDLNHGSTGPIPNSSHKFVASATSTCTQSSAYPFGCISSSQQENIELSQGNMRQPIIPQPLMDPASIPVSILQQFLADLTPTERDGLTPLKRKLNDQSYILSELNEEDGDSLLHVYIIYSSVEENKEEYCMPRYRAKLILYCLLERMEREGLLSKFIDLKNKCGQTPFYLAVVTGFVEAASLLLYYGADCNIKPGKFDGPAPVHKAVENNSASCLKLMIDDDKCDLNALNDGMTPLMKACIQGHIECAKMLLDCPRVDPFERSRCDGRTAMHFAVESKNLYLLQAFAPHSNRLHPTQLSSTNRPLSLVNVFSFAENTPLHTATGLLMNKEKQVELARLLLQIGADPNVKNGEGKIPKDIANKNKNAHQDLIDLFKLPRPGVQKARKSSASLLVRSSPPNLSNSSSSSSSNQIYMSSPVAVATTNPHNSSSGYNFQLAASTSSSRFEFVGSATPSPYSCYGSPPSTSSCYGSPPSTTQELLCLNQDVSLQQSNVVNNLPSPTYSNNSSVYVLSPTSGQGSPYAGSQLSPNESLSSSYSAQHSPNGGGNSPSRGQTSIYTTQNSPYPEQYSPMNGHISPNRGQGQSTHYGQHSNPSPIRSFVVDEEPAILCNAVTTFKYPLN